MSACRPRGQIAGEKGRYGEGRPGHPHHCQRRNRRSDGRRNRARPSGRFQVPVGDVPAERRRPRQPTRPEGSKPAVLDRPGPLPAGPVGTPSGAGARGRFANGRWQWKIRPHHCRKISRRPLRARLRRLHTPSPAPAAATIAPAPGPDRLRFGADGFAGCVEHRRLGARAHGEDHPHPPHHRRANDPLGQRRFRTSPISTTPTSPNWSGCGKACRQASWARTSSSR